MTFLPIWQVQMPCNLSSWGNYVDNKVDQRVLIRTDKYTDSVVVKGLSLKAEES